MGSILFGKDMFLMDSTPCLHTYCPILILTQEVAAVLWKLALAFTPSPQTAFDFYPCGSGPRGSVFVYTYIQDKKVLDRREGLEWAAKRRDYDDDHDDPTYIKLSGWWLLGGQRQSNESPLDLYHRGMARPANTPLMLQQHGSQSSSRSNDKRGVLLLLSSYPDMSSYTKASWFSNKERVSCLCCLLCWLLCYFLWSLYKVNNKSKSEDDRGQKWWLVKNEWMMVAEVAL